MDMIKVEPDSNCGTCPEHLLCYDQQTGLKQEGQNVPTAFPMIKMEVKVKCGNYCLFGGGLDILHFMLQIKVDLRCEN
jgi:hypothetical protein